MTHVNIGSTPFVATLRKSGIGLMIAGVLGLFAVYLTGGEHGQQRFIADYLVGFWYFTGVSVTMLFFVALQYLTRAGWSASVRRIAENLSGMVPFVAVFLIPIVVNMMGHHSIYEWTHPEAAQDKILSYKAPYLNMTFFLVRMGLYCLLWFGMLWHLVGNSVKQDTNETDITPTRRNWKRAAPWVLVYAMTITFASFDLMMSLEPHWFSTIWGIYTFTGHFVAALAIITLMVVYMYKAGLLRGYIREEHFHDLGKLMFAFSVFWAYIGFSQYFIIWYANIPEETVYFTQRTSGSWGIFGYLLMIFRFVLPFVLLLRQDVKRKITLLTVAAIVILVAHYIDIVWIVMPAVGKVMQTDAMLFGWQEFTGMAFFAGVFLYLAARLNTRRNAVAVNDPLIRESFEYHT
ncbi:MAG: quinol:cytochrome C oxidoreductase [Ignavibacteria bacterium]|nr:quinol:cytochrome C oxidoreductase [Ignavibacteria bacterium]